MRNGIVVKFFDWKCGLSCYLMEGGLFLYWGGMGRKKNEEVKKREMLCFYKLN